MTVELKQIAKRIRTRNELQEQDRKRQRELIRELRRGGATWDDMVEIAQVSRQTVADALKRTD